MIKPTTEVVKQKLRARGIEFDSVAFAPSIEFTVGSVAVLDGKPIELSEVTDHRITGRVISLSSWAEAHAVMMLTGDTEKARDVLDFGSTRPRKGKCRIVQNGPVWKYRFTNESVMLTKDRSSKKDNAMMICDNKLPVDWIVAFEKSGDVKTIRWSELSA